MVKNILLTSLRNMAKDPGHAFLNVAGLAIGLAAAFLITLWVQNEFSYDRFHTDAEKIFKILTHTKAEGSVQTYSAAEAGIDLSSIPLIEKVTRVSSGNRWPHEQCMKPNGQEGNCSYFYGIYTDTTFFKVFGFPIVGGDQTPLEDVADIVITERMAKVLYDGADPVGKILNIGEFVEVKVVSVIATPPANSSIQFDFILPLEFFKRIRGLDDDTFSKQFVTTYFKTARNERASALTPRLNDESVLPTVLKEQGLVYEAFPFTDWRLKSRFENGISTGGRIEYVSLFSIIALLVLVMASINFINLVIARSTTRSKEIGVRKVTGATRPQLVFQFMIESFLTVTAAALIAVVIVQTVLPSFNILTEEKLNFDLLSTSSFPLVIVAIFVVSGLSGIYPALVMSSFRAVNVLKNNKGPGGSSSLRKSLLAIQLSISTGIIIFSGTIYYQLNFIQTLNLGIDREKIIRIEPHYQHLVSFETFKTDMLQNAGIVNACMASDTPIGMNSLNNGVSWSGKPYGQRITFQTMGCSPEFFETFNLPFIDGEGFSSLTTDSLYREAVITKRAAGMMGFENPVGEKINIGDVPCVIKGVIDDFHSESLHKEMLPVVLYRAGARECSTVFVKYDNTTASQALLAIETSFGKIVSDTAMKYWYMDESFDQLYKTESIAGRLILVFTMIAIVISILGIVGLATFNLMRRVREISVRRIFGASVTQILSLLTREFVSTLVIASLIALPAAWYVSNQWLQGFAYRIDVPVSLMAISISTIAGITVFIICVQAFKTVSANPTETMRHE